MQNHRLRDRNEAAVVAGKMETPPLPSLEERRRITEQAKMVATRARALAHRLEQLETAWKGKRATP